MRPFLLQVWIPWYPCLHLNGNGEEVVGDVGFLRLIFVGELSFVPHVGNAGREVCKGPGCY